MVNHSWYASLSLRALPDKDLLARLEALVAQEREGTADVVEHLLEIDRRELSIDLAYPSLFAYCVKKLGYSEAAAFARIRAARAAASFPDVLERLRRGSLHLEAVVRLYPYLDQDNSRKLLDRASGATRREVLAIVAQLQPGPGAERDMIVPVRPPISDCPPQTQTPGAADSGEEPFSSSPDIVPPPQHRFHFTADAELLSLVEKLRGLMRHKIPDGRLEAIFKEAAKALVERIERDKFALGGPPKAPLRPAPPSGGGAKRSRIVPRAVKRAVWARDGGCCAYTAPDGRRCDSREQLEYDHILAWADGGRSDTADNIRLLCRVHNQRLSRRRFGPRRRS